MCKPNLSVRKKWSPQLTPLSLKPSVGFRGTDQLLLRSKSTQDPSESSKRGRGRGRENCLSHLSSKASSISIPFFSSPRQVGLNPAQCSIGGWTAPRLHAEFLKRQTPLLKCMPLHTYKFSGS